MFKLAAVVSLLFVTYLRHNGRWLAKLRSGGVLLRPEPCRRRSMNHHPCLGLVSAMSHEVELVPALEQAAEALRQPETYDPRSIELLLSN